jgi:hypothetical protein
MIISLLIFIVSFCSFIFVLIELVGTFSTALQSISDTVSILAYREYLKEKVSLSGLILPAATLSS